MQTLLRCCCPWGLLAMVIVSFKLGFILKLRPIRENIKQGVTRPDGRIFSALQGRTTGSCQPGFRSCCLPIQHNQAETSRSILKRLGNRNYIYTITYLAILGSLLKAPSCRHTPPCGSECRSCSRCWGPRSSYCHQVRTQNSRNLFTILPLRLLNAERYQYTSSW